MFLPIQVTCARLCTQVYSSAPEDLPLSTDPSLFADYEKVSGSFIPSSDLETGFYAEAWKNTQSGEVIIAIRGTDFNAETQGDWWDGNIPLALGSPGARQFEALKHFVDAIRLDQKVSTSEITFTGHSLGGGLAALAGLYYGSDTYTFAPAPFKNTADHFLFIPEGLDADSQAVLAAARDAYYQLLDLDYPPSEAEALAKGVAGYQAADAARIVILSTREALLTSTAIEGEVLSRYDGLFNLFGELSWVPKTENELADFNLSIGGDPSIFNVVEALSRHSIALHALVLQTDFGSFLSENDTVRDILLSNIVSPVSTPVLPDNLKANKDSSILYRAWLIDDDFRQEFTSSMTIIDTLDAFVQRGFALLGVQKARVFTDDWRLRGSHGNFDPWLSVSSDSIIVNMVGIDDYGAKDESGIAYGRASLDQAFREILEHTLLDEGYATLGTERAIANLLLGLSLDQDSPWSLSWSLAFAAVDGSSMNAVSLAGALVFGAAGNDAILGSQDGDFVYGGAGDDTIEGSGGEDVLIGGGENSFGDTASYASSEAGVDIHLGTIDQQSGGDAQGDVLIGFENVIGSEHTDTLRGDDGVNRLEGRGDADFFYVEGSGSAANGDTFDGGDGADWVVLADANDLGAISGLGGGSFRYSVDLGLGYVQGGSGPGIWANLESIENVTGSAYWDKIVGNAADNVILGGAGNDVIIGGGGNDTITGGGDRDPFDSEVDTVCFSGTWGNYQFTIDPNGYECIVVDDMAGGDGTDTIFGVEMFQFADVTLRWDEIANKGPTAISFAEGHSLIFEDNYGMPVSDRWVTTLKTVDDNNFNSANMVIDSHSYSLAAASQSYYGLIGDQVYKLASNLVDYEDWVPAMQSLYSAYVGPSIMSFGEWLNDIRDGVSSVNHSEIVSHLSNKYKFTVTSEDLHGASVSDSFIVFFNDIFGQISNALIGSNNSAVMMGTQGDDVFYGLGGNDVFLGDWGADMMIGGSGTDTVSYMSSMSVIVDLSSVGIGNFAEGDTYYGIENVIGGITDDVLIGDAGNNSLKGMHGADMIYGGDGIDTAVFNENLQYYSISRSGNGLYVNCMRQFSDGKDYVDSSVEWLQFADTTISTYSFLHDSSHPHQADLHSEYLLF